LRETCALLAAASSAVARKPEKTAGHKRVGLACAHAASPQAHSTVQMLNLMHTVIVPDYNHTGLH
jgi:hypothetical protein